MTSSFSACSGPLDNHPEHSPHQLCGTGPQNCALGHCQVRRILALAKHVELESGVNKIFRLDYIVCWQDMTQIGCIEYGYLREICTVTAVEDP
jgi:hypothetical protein